MSFQREPISEGSMRRSPVEPDLTTRGAHWSRLGDARLATRLNLDGTGATVTLCDLSPLGLVGVKGPQSSTWLAQRGLLVPEAIYQTTRLPDGGVVGRLGQEEFMVGGGTNLDFVTSIVQDLRASADPPYCVEREDASFLLAGDGSLAALAQTCGVDFLAAAEDQLVLTRVAGVSCTILPQHRHDRASWRLWCDPSFATYLWGQLTTIVEDLEGCVVGAYHCIDTLNTTEPAS